ncbi:sugar transferase [Prochlorococcus marinus]|uniref:sugar transferase n=1 Tax=Prochlorococcus marinus TaxID=1219 RepID=UPI001ADAAFAB|nr:sugar transferase [Prochlorococcus marinus]MBO8217651.1 sugar transferase [Prochlorococcus marinus XMU1405]MBW3040813.1 lipid carrier--UDP-N-acetylgalactosaminyltransferase [Prochlorococcus marinus str. MU1405]MBW3048272.1 lipid carrier--UDP-N-acetylgalactosaminyltransferase [Prochlorococcus marinus str. MU1406]
MKKILRKNNIIRFYDLTISLLLTFTFSPLFLILYFICFFDSGKPLFVQKRLGKNKKLFNLIKFRTMHFRTPSVASHLVDKKLVTKCGRIIRLLKLDELPQLFNVIRGEMSLVGPRPCLPNQTQLIKERQIYSIFSVKPGVTGLAQIKGIDMSNPKKLAKIENHMISNFHQINYFKYLFLTLYGKGIGDGIDN